MEHLNHPDQEVIFEQALEQAIHHLKEHWFDENVGIVAATLVDGTHTISATSLYLPEENRWLHAEAAALAQYEKQFGDKPSPSSTMIVTLSPCLLESSSRSGASCSERLLAAGISQVRYGCLDSKQTQGQSSLYQEIGFESELIGSPSSRQTCEALYRLFDELYLPDGQFNHLLNNLPNPWTSVKRALGFFPQS